MARLALSVLGVELFALDVSVGDDELVEWTGDTGTTFVGFTPPPPAPYGESWRELGPT